VATKVALARYREGFGGALVSPTLSTGFGSDWVRRRRCGDEGYSFVCL